jgi:hypothetical protein
VAQLLQKNLRVVPVPLVVWCGGHRESLPACFPV